MKSLLAEAEKLKDKVDTRDGVFELVKVYETVLEIEPDNRSALGGIGSCYFLLGYGYGKSRDEKEQYYLKSIQYCEQLVYLNPEFKIEADKGADIWDALDVLTENDMNALWWWFLAAGSYVTECHSTPVKIINAALVLRIKAVMTRMMAINPQWQNGSPYYLSANYYAQSPALFGRDLEKSVQLFKKAVKTGPTMLNFRRTRARNLHTKTGNREGFIADMEWVLKQDPHKAPLGYLWNSFVQRDAREGLAEIDSLFPRPSVGR